MVDTNGQVSWICCEALAGYLKLKSSDGTLIKCSKGSRNCPHPHPTLCTKHLHGNVCSYNGCRYNHLSLWKEPPASEVEVISVCSPCTETKENRTSVDPGSWAERAKKAASLPAPVRSEPALISAIPTDRFFLTKK